MKFSTAAFVAIFVVPAQGFSISMSTVSYLDNISTGFSAGASYGASPSSSSPAPAPLPEPYVSSFADAPPSNGLNYMGSIAGGSAMKTGKNYSGFQPNKAVVNVSINVSTPAPAPAPYVSPVAATPVSNGLNYMGSLGGGSAMKSGPNYNGFQPIKSAGNNAISTPAPVPQVSSVASTPAGTQVVSNGLNYMGSLGGGSAMKSGKNYNGFKSLKSTGNSVISAPAAAAYVGAVVNAPVTNSLNYMGSLGGGSAMKSGKNYNGFKSLKSTGNAATSAPDPAPQVSSVAATPAAATQVVSNGLNYMGSLGGGSAMKSGPNFNGFKSIQSTGNVAASAPAPAPQVSSAAATQVVSNGLNYMGSLGGGSAMKSGKNYNGFKSNKAVGNSVISAPAAAAYVSAVAPVVSNGLNYMGSLGGGSAMKSGKNYNGFQSIKSAGNSAISSPAPAAYVSPVAAAPAPAPYVSPVVATPVVSNGLNYMGSLGGGSAMKSGKNYNGMNTKFVSAESGNSYLDSVAPATAGAVSGSYNSMQDSFAAATGAATPASAVSYLSSL